jgi:hypothetical protein
MPNNREIPSIAQRRLPVYDNEILMVVKAAGGLGKHDADGEYGTFKLHGFNSREEADLHRRGLYASALWMSGKPSKPKNILPGGYRLSVQVKVLAQDDGTFSLSCMVGDKEHAYRKLTEKYGPNVEDWPYSPYKYRNHRNYNT